MKKFRDINRTIQEQTDTTEKVEMTQSQLHFIHYACEEILDYIKQGGEVEEWYQVKVAKSFSEFESLHSFIEGEKRRTGMVKEETKNSDKDNAPFDADKKPVVKATPGKHGVGPSTAKHLAKMAMQKQMKKEDVEQIDEISSELAGKVSDARFKRVMSMDRNDPKKPEASAKFSRSSESARKRITRDMIKDPEKANRGFASDADKNTKRGWSNESVEQIDELSKKTLGNYVKSASHDVAAKAAATRQHSVDAHRKNTEGDFTGARDSMKKSDKSFSDSWKRRNNMAKAVDRLTKEEIAIENQTDAGRSLKEKPNKEPMPKMKKPLAESRKAEIVKEIVKKKKNEINLSKGEKFQPEPVLTSQIVKEDK
jgi:hypothetical protein